MTARKLKTAYGEGVVFCLRDATPSKPGKYRARVGRPGKDQRSRTFEASSDTAAKTYVRQLDVERRGSRPVFGQDRTVSDLLAEWLQHGQNKRGRPWRESSRRSYESRTKVLRDALGARKVEDLSVKILHDAYAAWRNQGKSAGTVHALHETLTSALTYGRIHGWVMIDGLTSDSTPEPAGEREAIPADDFVALVDGARAKGGRVGVLVEILTATGCRVAEACGLRWEDIDLDGGHVRIQRQRTPFGDAPTKTASGVRTIDLAPGTVERLRAFQGQPDEYVVGVAPQGADKAFARLVKDLELPHYTPHQVRHNVTDWLVLVEGVSVPDAAYILGHNDGGTLLLKTYASRLNEANRPRVAIAW